MRVIALPVLRVLLALLGLCGPAAAVERVALVIGNAAYQHAAPLQNPRNDAIDIAATLTDMGFAVDGPHLDLDLPRMKQVLRGFRAKAARAEVAVTYFAGHAIEQSWQNYLLPVDASLATDLDVEPETVHLSWLVNNSRAARSFSLIILDACRDNPLAGRMKGLGGGTRSVARGLARVDPTGSTYIAYAAKEGTVASDGSGRNSPYAAALLAHMATPGLPLERIFGRVRESVLAKTGGQQEPHLYASSSAEPLYLVPPSEASPPQVAAKEGATGGEETARAAYEAAERIGTVAAYEAVLSRYPASVFADLARAAIDRLKSETQTAALPKADPPIAEPRSDAESIERTLGLTREDRRKIQQSLNALAHDAGTPDGLFGSRSRAAIRSYQRKTRRDATGYLTAEQAKILIDAAPLTSPNSPPTGQAAAQTAAPPASPPAAEVGRLDWRMSSSWGSNVPQIGESAARFSREIERQSDGRMRIKFFDPGTLAAAHKGADEVAAGTIDAAFTAAGYRIDKVPAMAFFTAVPFGPFGLDLHEWASKGEGKRLYDELNARSGLKAIACSFIGTESAGWFKRPLTSTASLRGLKMRIFGLGARVMQRLGVSTQLLAGGDIYPALERGTIDATEFSTPYLDIHYGFYNLLKYNYYPAWHQRAALSELVVSLSAWRQLSPAQRSLIEQVCHENVIWGHGRDEERTRDALRQLRDRHGVTIKRVPPGIVAAARRAWNEIADEDAARDPDFARVLRAYRRFLESRPVKEPSWFGAALN